MTGGIIPTGYDASVPAPSRGAADHSHPNHCGLDIVEINTFTPDNPGPMTNQRSRSPDLILVMLAAMLLLTLTLFFTGVTPYPYGVIVLFALLLGRGGSLLLTNGKGDA